MSNHDNHIPQPTAEDVANEIAQIREVQEAAIALRPENFERWFASNQARLVRQAAQSWVERHRGSNCDDHARQAKVTDPFTGEARAVCQDCGADCGGW